MFQEKAIKKNYIFVCSEKFQLFTPTFFGGYGFQFPLLSKFTGLNDKQKPKLLSVYVTARDFKKQIFCEFVSFVSISSSFPNEGPRKFAISVSQVLTLFFVVDTNSCFDMISQSNYIGYNNHYFCDQYLGWILFLILIGNCFKQERVD